MNYKYILSCDLETTSDSPTCGDWITGSFCLKDFQTLETIREIDLTSRPRFWSEEAFGIHKIRKDVALNFPPRLDALRALIEFLPDPRSFLFLCHANTVSKESSREYKEGSVYNSPLFTHFDFAYLKMDFFDHLSIFEFRKYFNDRDVYSTWTYANELIDRKILPKDLDLSLEGLCSYFKIPYGQHNSRLDRISLDELYFKMRNIDDHGRTIRERHSELYPGVLEIQGTRRDSNQQRFDV